MTTKHRLDIENMENEIHIALEKVEGVLKIVYVLADQKLLSEFEHTYSIAYIADRATEELSAARNKLEQYFKMVRSEQ